MSLKALQESLFYPEELSALLKFKFSANNKKQSLKDIACDTERKCFEYLFLTSRSFAAVIHELDVELRLPICLFYLVLRGLDTIEDDMTIPIERKVELLTSFHELIYQPGWTFHESKYIVSK
jgi:farnesyl-diphosphate farnesyltransferase